MSDLASRLGPFLGDRYRFGDKIGRGAMAEVYAAKNLATGQEVAIKILRPDCSASVAVTRFQREVELVASFDHPNIIPLLDSGTADDLYYYVMPLVEGETLWHRIEREEKLDLDEVVRITKRVTDALAYAHHRAVVHRDIKPANILLQGDSVYVADFGIARVMDYKGARLTTSGVIVGTPEYMSPEQASGSLELDGRSDLYSLACVIHEMMTGQPPFLASSVQATIASQIHDVPPRISAVREALPSSFDQAIARALAKRPTDRWQSVTEFQRAIDGALKATKPRPSGARPAALPFLAVAAVTLIIALIFFWRTMVAG